MSSSTRIVSALRICIVTSATLWSFSPIAAAQDSPYTDLKDRETKALSAERVAGLLNGDGLGYALAAELNSYPGPKHVIEFADSLALSDEQRTVVERVFDAMRSAAQPLGLEIVEAEAALDSVFAAGDIRADDLGRRLRKIAVLEGRLRFTHLQAHLEVRELLSAHQRNRYDQLRGYAAAEHRHEH